MKLFSCARCDHLAFFENSSCVRCGALHGFASELGRLVTLLPEGDALRAFDSSVAPPLWRHCANEQTAACNWIVPADRPGLCFACRLTRTRPNDADESGLAALAKTEAAKRRLVFQLLSLGLPVVAKHDDPEGLAFDLLWQPGGSVTTGHVDGVITIDLTESEDAGRERLRVQLDEPFRTLLGHMRHEIGHYYWPKLVPWARIEEFRSLFGDESADYGANLERHYAQGPPAGWETEYVSAYATMHPYEDWAETFAHYLHTRDVLETAAAAGMVLSGGGVVGEPAADLVSDPAGAVAQGDFDRIVRAWVPLSVGLNAVTRAMGKRDLYPFVLATRPIEKLRFVHHCIAAATRA